MDGPQRIISMLEMRGQWISEKILHPLKLLISLTGRFHDWAFAQTWLAWASAHTWRERHPGDECSGTDLWQSLGWEIGNTTQTSHDREQQEANSADCTFIASPWMGWEFFGNSESASKSKLWTVPSLTKWSEWRQYDFTGLTYKRVNVPSYIK